MQSSRPGTQSWVVIRRALAQRARRYGDAEDETAADEAFVKAAAAAVYRVLEHPDGPVGAWTLCSERKQLILCMMEAFQTLVCLCKDSEDSPNTELRLPLFIDSPLRDTWQVLLSLVRHLDITMSTPDHGPLTPYLRHLVLAVHGANGALPMPDVNHWLHTQMQRFDLISSQPSLAQPCPRTIASPSPGVPNRDSRRLPPILIPGGRSIMFIDGPRSTIKRCADRNNAQFRSIGDVREPTLQRSRSPQLVPTSSTLPTAVGSATTEQLLVAPAMESEIAHTSLACPSGHQRNNMGYDDPHSAESTLGEGSFLLSPLVPGLELDLLNELPAVDVDDPAPSPPAPRSVLETRTNETPPRHITLTYTAPRHSPSPTVVVAATETSPAHVDFATMAGSKRRVSGLRRRRPPGINAAELARREAEPAAAQVVPAASASTSEPKSSDTPGSSAPSASASVGDAAGENALLRAISATFVRDMLATPPTFARIGIKATPLPEHVVRFLERGSGRV